MTTSTPIRLLALTLASATDPAIAAVYTFDNLNSAIPDGNPVGIVSTGTVSGVPGAVSSLTVSITVGAGYNGDLFASLIAPDGMTTVILMNQPGVTQENPFGYEGSGMNVTFSASAADSIQTTAQPAGLLFTGTFLPAGNLGVMSGTMANGVWSLFMADLSTGSQATLTSWSLDISAVPEPTAGALASLAIFAALVRRRRPAR